MWWKEGANSAVSKEIALLTEVQGCVWAEYQQVWLEKGELWRMHSRLEVLGPGHGGLTGHQRNWDFTPCELKTLESFEHGDMNWGTFYNNYLGSHVENNESRINQDLSLWDLQTLSLTSHSTLFIPSVIFFPKPLQNHKRFWAPSVPIKMYFWLL